MVKQSFELVCSDVQIVVHNFVDNVLVNGVMMILAYVDNVKSIVDSRQEYWLYNGSIVG